MSLEKLIAKLRILLTASLCSAAIFDTVSASAIEQASIKEAVNSVSYQTSAQSQLTEPVKLRRCIPWQRHPVTRNDNY